MDTERADVVRLFVAVWLPSAWAEQVGELQRRWRRALPGERIRWVRPDNLHVTLAFLGDVPAQSVDSLAETLRPRVQAVRPFDVEAGGLGVFPHWRRPRVMWIGLRRGAEAMARLADEVRTGLAAAGYPFDDKPFRPHVTVARLPEGLSAEAMAKLRSAPWELEGPSTVTYGLIVSSRLQPGGSVYRHEAKLALGEG